MDKFKVLEDEATADIAFVAYGKSLEELYENAGIGIFSLITKIEDVDQIQVDLITIEAEDREALMLDFLNELVYRWDTEKILFSDFSCSIDESDGSLRLSAECRGEIFDEDKHKIKASIKAVTYFGMKIVEEDGIWKSKITPDV